MRTFARISLLTLVVAGLSSLAAAATSIKLPDLAVSDLFTPAGHMTTLRAGVTYQATKLPIAVRITPPDGSWAGAQWKANLFPPDELQRRHLTCSTSPAVCQPPYYGWAAVGQGGTNPKRPPRGLILIMTSYSRTPSVAWTVDSLRTRGHGFTVQPVSQVKLAGYSGMQFDGQMVGAAHTFIPFSPRTHKATGWADGIELEGAGHAFRFIVLNVRGKTVVVFVGSYVLSVAEFPTFLAKADQILKSLRFSS